MGKPADFCANYISKGRLVAIQGSIRIDRYQTQSGENRTFTRVNANRVQFLDSNRNKSESPYTGIIKVQNRLLNLALNHKD